MSDVLWLDLNNDGLQDPSEPGIPGVTVTANWFGPDGAEGGGDDQLLTTQTDSDGLYVFEGLPAGMFDVQIDTGDTDFPQGLVATGDADGVDTPDHAVVVLAAGDVRDDVDFGYAGTASLGDLVWLDLDGDGSLNGAEVGLEGVAVDLTWFGADGLPGTGDEVIVRSETDADGVYGAANVPYGEYDVRVVTSTVAAGLAPSFDLDGGFDHSTLVTLTGTPLDRVDVDFGYRGTSEIGDLVWADIDASGVLDGAETGLDGVSLEISLAGADGILETADDIVLDTTTSGGGGYNVEGLPAGPISVRVVDGIPVDHAQVSGPDAGIDGTWSGVLGGGESNLDVDFGYRPDADLSIVISHDGNFVVGENETLTIEVANAGPADANSVVATTTLPPGLTFVSGSGMDCTAIAQVVTCTVSTLTTGASVTIDLTVAVDEDAAPSFVASATVESSTPDRDPTNNVDEDPVVVPLAELAVDLTIPSSLSGGESGTVSVAVTNSGPSSSEAVVVTLDLPPGVSFQSVVGAGWTCVASGVTVTCTLADSLAPGASTTFDLVVDVSNTVSGNVVVGAAVASATPQASTAIVTDSVTASVAAPGVLALTGRNSRSLLFLAAIMIALGTVLMVVDRRKRARPDLAR